MIPHVPRSLMRINAYPSHISPNSIFFTLFRDKVDSDMLRYAAIETGCGNVDARHMVNMRRYVV